MNIKYIYLDDEPDDESIANAINAELENLTIVPRTPLSFGSEIERLGKEKYDGLILDLRLDTVVNNKIRAEYRALTLAQEIRTRATEGNFRGFPIVMCSTYEKINRSYKKDETGHDLFDARYTKSKMVDNSQEIAKELESLALGYKTIQKIKSKVRSKVNLADLFSLSEKSALGIDKRLTDYFTGFDSKLPDHEYARLIMKEMILGPGVLINESLLATRLGIDKGNSEDWEDLLQNVLVRFQYKGVFHEAWQRWWMHLVNGWWGSLKDNPGSLSNLDAEQRTSFLIKTFKTKKLNPISPIKENYSKKFWVLCKGHNKPIDPIDGLLVDGKSTQPWQEREYISIDAALKRLKYKDGVRIHPLEEKRFSLIKKELNG